MPRAKKETKDAEETALAKVTTKDTKANKVTLIVEDQHKKFRDEYENKFFVIKDNELAKIILDDLGEDGFTLKQLVLLLGWDEPHVEVIMNCFKTSSLTLKLKVEKDFILYLIKKDILPEGNYIVLVT